MKVATFGVGAALAVGLGLPTASEAQEFGAGGVTVSRPAAPPDKAKSRGTSPLSAVVPTPAETLAEIPISDAFATVGRGFDPATGRILDIVCVEGTEADHSLGEGTIVKADMRVVSDEKSHANASGSSVGFSAMIKAVSFGFGTSSSEASMFNSVDQYARIYSRIATVGTERRNVRWSADARRLLQTNMAEFLKQCGTRYVRAVYAGHLLDTSVHFMLNKEVQTSADAAGLSIGVQNLFSVSGAVSDADASLNQLASARLIHHGRGTLSLPPAPSIAPPAGDAVPAFPPAAQAPADPAPPAGQSPADTANPPQAGGPSSSAGSSSSAAAGAPPTPVSPLAILMNYYNTGFAAAVAADKKKSALPLYIVADRYVDKYGLSGSKSVPIWADTLMAAVAAKRETYDDLVTAISNLRDALAPRPTSRIMTFYVETADVAKGKQATAAQILADFQAAVKTCQALLAAGNERTANGTAAVDVCQRALDTSLTSAKVAEVTLTRKFS
jgi:hypothetical protein